MSRIGSSSGVRVAAQPLSNVYTVLLLVAILALTTTAVFLGVKLETHYPGGFLGWGEKVDKALQDARDYRADQERSLNDMDSKLNRFPGGAGAPEAPPAEGG